MDRSVPTDAKQRVLQSARERFGFVPNMFREISNNPAVARSFLCALDCLSDGTLEAREQQVVMLVVSAWNECHYCTAAHRIAGRRLGVAAVDLERVGQGQYPAEPRLGALTTATRMVLEKHGWLDTGDLNELTRLGIDRPQLYEIIAFVGLMTVSNYVNHIHGTELDEGFLADAKKPGELEAAS